MALSPNTDEAFLREVEEDLRRDRMLAIWRNYGRWLVLAAILGIAAFGGWLWWQEQNKTQTGVVGEQFQEAIDALGANQVAKAEPLLKQVAESDIDGFVSQARFTQADILLQKDDLKGAAAKFAEVASDTTAPKPLRDLALLRQTAAEYDTMQPQAVIDRLRPLAVKDSPWFGSAGEMTAIAYLRMGRKDLAGRLFGDIAKTETVPASIRQRAVQLAGVLGVDAVAQPEEPKAK